MVDHAYRSGRVQVETLDGKLLPQPVALRELKKREVSV